MDGTAAVSVMFCFSESDAVTVVVALARWQQLSADQLTVVDFKQLQLIDCCLVTT